MMFLWIIITTVEQDKIEKVQRRFTKRLPGFKHMTYGDRLKTLNIQSLEYCWLILDLVMCYKIVHELIDLTVSDFFSFDNLGFTGGHSNKLVKQHSPVNAHSTVEYRLIPVCRVYAYCVYLHLFNFDCNLVCF